MQDDITVMADRAADLANTTNDLAAQMAAFANSIANFTVSQQSAGGSDFFITGLTVFVLACFVGYYVVWRVTPALHSPLMAVTNAISSVIIVGALMAAGAHAAGGFSKSLGMIAIVLASINIFGGFIITRRMLHMFRKKS